jgi:hypothetical protein
MATILGWLFILLIIALVIAIILTIMEKVTKIIIPILIIALLIVGAFYFVKDVTDLQQNFAAENKIFLLDLDKEIVGAFTVRGNEDPVLIKDFTTLNKQYPNNLDKILGNYYKVVIVHWSAFDDLQQLDLDIIQLSRQDILDALNSEDPKTLLPVVATNMFETGDEIKSTLFAFMFSEKNQKTNLIEQHRAGTADIYPETIGLKIIKLIPESILKKLVKVN